MVFVAVSDHDADDLRRIFDQITEIRYDHIDTIHFVFRKGHSAVDDQYLLFIFQHGQIFSDLVESADGNDL